MGSQLRVSEQRSLCLVSTLVFSEQPLPVCFFYREMAQHENDTGFRFFSGWESDEFLIQEDSACVAPLSSLLKIDPSIEQLLSVSSIGCVWERCETKKTWLPVTDYEIPESIRSQW
jgi:hypothetical protein